MQVASFPMLNLPAVDPVASLSLPYNILTPNVSKEKHKSPWEICVVAALSFGNYWVRFKLLSNLGFLSSKT